MKSIYSILFTFLFLGCTNVLDKKPLDSITDDAVWSDPNLIDAFLTNQYTLTSVFVNECPEYISSWSLTSPIKGNLGVTGLFLSEHGGGFLTINDLGDETKGVWDFVGVAAGAKANGITRNGGVLEWWENAYYVIRNLNILIERIPASPMEASLAKRRIAEARFLRAFNYFSMVKRYGGVPLITKVQNLTDPDEVLRPKRDTEQALYDFILAELDAVANDLPATDYGRPSKIAALALKSRAALYAGSIAKYGTVKLNGVLGISPALAKAYYKKAYDAASAIITAKTHKLYNANANKALNFREIFTVKRNVEQIFAKEHNFISALDAGGGTWDYDFAQRPQPHPWGGGMAQGPYLDFVESFENTDGTSGKLDLAAIQTGLWTTQELWGKKDPRFIASVYTQGTPWRGTIIDFHKGLITPSGEVISGSNEGYNNVKSWGTQNIFNTGEFGTGFGVLKYLDEKAEIGSTWSNSGTDYTIFRYAEVLLNLAEAAVEMGNFSDDAAVTAMRDLRTRAGMPELPALTIDNIRHERKVELAFEGHRYWDVRRWRIAEKELTGARAGLQYILDYTTRKFRLKVLTSIDGTGGQPNFTAKNYYFPITSSRIAANTNLVENPDY